MAARTFTELVDGAPAGRCPAERATVIELSSDVLTVVVTALGAATHRVVAPDRHGVPGDVQLHLATLADRADRSWNPHLGSSIGRWAGRIGGAAFPLADRTVHLVANEGPNQLHGGPDGFDRRTWALADLDDAGPSGGSVAFGLTSVHGDQGFPGALSATATYVLDGATLTVAYAATTDAPTVVNLCHHSYWNLAGGLAPGSAAPIGDHLLAIAADRVLPLDPGGLPTGPPVPVVATPFDLRAPRPIGAVLAELGRGLDHTFAIDAPGPLPAAVRPVAELSHPGSGRRLQVATDQPGLQAYSGDHLRPPFAPRTALSLEAQRFPDAPNRTDLGPARLDPGDRYASTTRLTFSSDA